MSPGAAIALMSWLTFVWMTDVARRYPRHKRLRLFAAAQLVTAVWATWAVLS